MKLRQMAIVKKNFPEADFWLVREGQITQVGAPVKDFDADYIGVKVLQDNIVGIEFDFDFFKWIRVQGHWRKRARGEADVKRISVSMVMNLNYG